MKYISTSYSFMLRAFLVLLAACLSDVAFGQMPINLDFENGNFSNWTCWIGQSAAGTPTTGTKMDSSQITAAIGGNAPCSMSGAASTQSRHFITSSSSSNPCSTIPEVCPAGANYSLRLGNLSTNRRADKVQYYLHVPASAPSYNVLIQYLVVLEKAHQFEPAKAPTFQVVVRDSASESILPRANSLYINPYISTHLASNISVSWTPTWTASTLNLRGMSGKTVLLEVSVMACADAGHFSYAYFDVVSVHDTLQPGFLGYNANCDSVTLQAPPGYKKYEWFNQNFSQAFNAPGDTVRVRTLPVPTAAQYYNLILTPYAANGAADTIQSQVLQPCSLSTGVSTMQQARVYPNPANDMLHLDLGVVFDGSLSVRNALGQDIFEQTLSKTTQYDLSTVNFPPGLYSLQLRGRDGDLRSLKFVVSR